MNIPLLVWYMLRSVACIVLCIAGIFNLLTGGDTRTLTCYTFAPVCLNVETCRINKAIGK